MTGILSILTFLIFFVILGAMLNHYFKNTYTALPVATYAEEFCFPPKAAGTQTVTGFHYHSEFEVLLIDDGQIDFVVGSVKFSAGKHDIVIVNPYDPHYSDCPKSLPRTAYRCVDFDLSLMAGLMDKSLLEDIAGGRLRFCPLLTGAAHQEAAALVGQLYDCAAYQADYWTYGVKAAALGLLYYLLSKGLTEAAVASTKNGKTTEFAKSVLAYIDAHYMHKITSETAAGHLAFNKSYFCRLFKKTFGDSFSNYLNFYRVSKARSLIAEGETNMSRLAAAVGFDELSYFSSTFKKHLGKPPSACL